MKSDTKTRNTKKTIVRMLAAMLIGGVIGGVSTVVYEIVFGEDFSGRSLSLLTEVTRKLMVPCHFRQCLSFQLQHMRSASKS